MKEPVQEENPILESHALPSGSRGDEGILEGVAITDNLEETYSSESDEGVSFAAHPCMKLCISLTRYMVYIGRGHHYPCR